MTPILRRNPAKRRDCRWEAFQTESLLARELLEGLLARQHVSRLFGHSSGVFWLDSLKQYLILPVSQHVGAALRPDGGLKRELSCISDFKLRPGIWLEKELGANYHTTRCPHVADSPAPVLEALKTAGKSGAEWIFFIEPSGRPVGSRAGLEVNN
jgi:hypothetical protein